MSELNESGKAIFYKALPIADHTERESFLLDACGDNPSLLETVRRLLAADESAPRILNSTAANSEWADGSVDKQPTRIGRYKLLERIGEGGFGVVFMAEQQQPVSRMVALKIIKPGMDSKQVIARFESERQAFALMDHPNIASVLDAGETELGHPYFVMELVRGLAITEYCDEHRLSTRDRLFLFADVCSAIHHAHQKGVIHRDIKPSNILVSTYVIEQVPK